MKAVINKAFRYRLYPTENQKKFFSNQFGQVRFVYNYFLRKRIDYYAANKGNGKQTLNYHDTCKMLTALKRQPEFAWLNETNSQSLQQSLRQLETAYSHFFKDGYGFPTFKKKNQNQSFTVPQNFTIDAESGLLRIPKIDPIRFVPHRSMEGKAKHITISQTPSGKHFVSILCEINKNIKAKCTGGEIGIDLGLKFFLATSEDEKVDPPKFFRRSEGKLRLLQRRLSRKKKGSNNRNKARIKVACIHEKIANQRNDFLHKLSNRLVSENQAIFVEDVNAKKLVSDHHWIGKSVWDVGWKEFIRQIGYKSEWNGVRFARIDPVFPSSSRCNACGWINNSLMLKDRRWTCHGCNLVLDRDLNAARNILLFGQKQISQELRKSTPGERRCMKAPHRTRKLLSSTKG